ncbi:hypothetical protein AGMMS50239_10160 [Bacteroidia bacterium]|nr:hypothetical protein AGMMS50239_10160 [Bacteroidia bacterium]
MQKVVIDTNVIVSALIQKSYPFKIVNELFIAGKIILCVSESLMNDKNCNTKRLLHVLSTGIINEIN